MDFLKDIEDHSNNNLIIIPFYSEEKGHIDADYLSVHTKDISKRDIFICAPPRMIEELRKDLINKRISTSKIHSEEFNF